MTYWWGIYSRLAVLGKIFNIKSSIFSDQELILSTLVLGVLNETFLQNCQP